MDFIAEVLYQIFDWALKRIMKHPWIASTIAFVLSMAAFFGMLVLFR